MTALLDVRALTRGAGAGPSDENPTLNADTWVIVPAFNEEAVIGEVLSGLRARFKNVVAVDDGNLDGTAAVIREAGARLVRHSKNLGPGAAVQTGVEFALLDPAARYFVLFDGDGQHRVQDAVSMIERIRGGDLEVLLGSRFLGHADGIGTLRRALLACARLFELTTTGVRLTDAHNGLRVFSRSFATQLRFRHADFAHCSEFVELVARSGLRYAEHPVTVSYTDYSKRKGQRHINSVNIAVDILLRQLLERGEPR